MSEDEFNRISRGEDLWMQSAEIRKRLDRMMKVLAEEAEKPVRKPRKKKAATEEDVVEE